MGTNLFADGGLGLPHVAQPARLSPTCLATKKGNGISIPVPRRGHFGRHGLTSCLCEVAQLAALDGLSIARLLDPCDARCRFMTIRSTRSKISSGQSAAASSSRGVANLVVAGFDGAKRVRVKEPRAQLRRPRTGSFAQGAFCGPLKDNAAAIVGACQHLLNAGSSQPPPRRQEHPVDEPSRADPEVRHHGRPQGLLPCGRPRQRD